MADTEYELAISCSQARLQVAGLGCIYLSCWSRGSHGDPQTSKADARTEGCSIQTDNKAPLLRSISTQLIEQRGGAGAFVEYMQRLTARHYEERESTLNVSIRSFLSELWELCRRGAQRILEVRRDGGQQENKSH